MLDAEQTREPLTIFETNESKSYWLEQDLAKGLKSALEAADILIVPIQNYRGEVPFAFHQDTPAVYRYLAAQLKGKATVELCVSDAEYLEIALHSASFRFSSIVVTFVIAPLVVNLLSSYVYDELKAKPTDKVELELIIEDHDCKAFKFTFDGEVKDLNIVADKVGQMARDCTAKGAAKSSSAKVKK